MNSQAESMAEAVRARIEAEREQWGGEGCERSGAGRHKPFRARGF
jgi:hypothetical protein